MRGSTGSVPGAAQNIREEVVEPAVLASLLTLYIRGLTTTLSMTVEGTTGRAHAGGASR